MEIKAYESGKSTNEKIFLEAILQESKFRNENDLLGKITFEQLQNRIKIAHYDLKCNMLELIKQGYVKLFSKSEQIKLTKKALQIVTLT